MNPKFVSSVIFVQDIECSKKFYHEVLKQDVEFDFGSNIMFKSGLSLWQIQPDHVITRSSQKQKVTGQRFELYFEVEDIREAEQKIRSNGLKFLHEIMEESWGQQTFRFFDPDNHLVEIGEKMEVFATRIYNKTGSAEKTSELTGIPVNILKQYIRDW